MVKKGYKQTEIGVIPEDWAIKYLSDFGKVQGGGTPSTTMADYWGGDIAWCTPSDITSAPTKYINATERAITDLGLKNSAATVKQNSKLIGVTYKRFSPLAPAWSKSPMISFLILPPRHD